MLYETRRNLMPEIIKFATLLSQNQLKTYSNRLDRFNTRTISCTTRRNTTSFNRNKLRQLRLWRRLRTHLPRSVSTHNQTKKRRKSIHTNFSTICESQNSLNCERDWENEFNLEKETTDSRGSNVQVFSISLLVLFIRLWRRFGDWFHWFEYSNYRWLRWSTPVSVFQSCIVEVLFVDR